MIPTDEMMRVRNAAGTREKLANAVAGVAGLGGLGSHIAAALARAGVGKLVIADFDSVEPGNLNRQNYFVAHLGMRKADATKELLAQINPYCKVEAFAERVTDKNAGRIFAGCEVVCEAFDAPEEKAMLASAVFAQMPGVVLVAASGMAGYGSSNLVRTVRRMKNLYICGDMETEPTRENGLMAPRALLCSAHQANMALRILLGENEA